MELLFEYLRQKFLLPGKVGVSHVKDLCRSLSSIPSFFFFPHVIMFWLGHLDDLGNFHKFIVSI